MVHILYIGLAIVSLPLLASNDAAQPKSYNIEQFLNASERELLAHKRKLDELEKQGKLNISPSQAQLFSDPVKIRKQMEESVRDYSWYARRNTPKIDPRWYGGNVASTLFDPRQISALNKAMAKDEKIHAQGGTAVYHSTPVEAYAQSYIRTKAEELARELQGQPVAPSKWLMLRNYRDNLDIEKQNRKYLLAKGAADLGFKADEIPSIAEYMMSCSVGLPSTGRMESALFFWEQAAGSKNRPPRLRISGQYSPELTTTAGELYDEADKLKKALNTGILLQMQVKDKRLLNKLMYTSGGFGSKWNYRVRDAENTVKELEGPQPLIETTMTNPSAFLGSHFLMQPQTRVVLTGDLMLDPTNPKIRENVAFNAYADNQEALDKFHTNVDAYFAKQKNRIKADYQMRYNKMNLPQKFWHNMQTRLCTPSSYAERKMLRKEGGNLFIRGNTFSGE